MVACSPSTGRAERGSSPAPVRALALAWVALFSACGTQQFLHVERRPLGERFEALLGGGGNSVVLFHGADALVVDLKMGEYARRLWREVEVDHQHHARRVVLTHGHADHVGGLSLFQGAEVVLVHPNTRARLAAAGVRARWVEVEREVRLNLGGEPVRVMHLGPAHTDGDLVVLFPGRKLLASGDLLLDGYIPYADTRAGGDLLHYGQVLDGLLELEFTDVVPGHGAVVPRGRLQHARDYLAALEAEVRKARAARATVEEAVRDVRVKGFDDLANIPFGANREKNVRDMYGALEQEGRR